MNLPRKTGVTAGYTTLLSGGGKTYHVEVWCQAWHRWLAARLYHWYDMRVHRVPGFRALERLLERLHRGELLYVPLGCRQDLRCHDLAARGREVLAVLEVDRDVYDTLTPP